MARGFDKWRKLPPEDLKRALMKAGVPEDAAEEYLDDPNAIPRALRAKLNRLVESRQGDGEI